MQAKLYDSVAVTIMLPADNVAIYDSVTVTFMLPADNVACNDHATSRPCCYQDIAHNVPKSSGNIRGYVCQMYHSSDIDVGRIGLSMLEQQEQPCKPR